MTGTQVELTTLAPVKVKFPCVLAPWLWLVLYVPAPAPGEKGSLALYRSFSVTTGVGLHV